MPSSGPRGKGRVGRPYLRACAALRAKCLPCWLCGHPIDYYAPPRTRWSFSVDHVIPLRPKHGEPGAELDPSNLASAHYGCNSRKGNRTVEQMATAGYTSPHW